MRVPVHKHIYPDIVSIVQHVELTHMQSCAVFAAFCFISGSTALWIWSANVHAHTHKRKQNAQYATGFIIEFPQESPTGIQLLVQSLACLL